MCCQCFFAFLIISFFLSLLIDSWLSVLCVFRDNSTFYSFFFLFHSFLVYVVTVPFLLWLLLFSFSLLSFGDFLYFVSSIFLFFSSFLCFSLSWPFCLLPSHLYIFCSSYFPLFFHPLFRNFLLCIFCDVSFILFSLCLCFQIYFSLVVYIFFDLSPTHFLFPLYIFHHISFPSSIWFILPTLYSLFSFVFFFFASSRFLHLSLTHFLLTSILFLLFSFFVSVQSFFLLCSWCFYPFSNLFIASHLFFIYCHFF